jgi:glycosyltransferase involved in cell wall biosynthesis
MPSVSVIVCTYNPRPDYLQRTLDGLRAQTFPQDQWQLLVVDNRSDEPLAGRIDLSWHPHGRIVREENPGLTPARLRGIRESEGGLLIFVDDDNVLAPDYLASAVNLFEKRPDLGLASGCLLPEYEAAPPPWFTGEYESWLAVRRLKKSAWSSFSDSQSEPAGAGLCLRRSVAQAYLEDAQGNRFQLLLGRRGKSLLSGEDVALSKIALFHGYSIGQFVDLKLTHLIPARRVEPDYLFSLYRHIVASGMILGWLDTPAETRGSHSFRLSLSSIPRELYKSLFQGPIRRRLAWERFQARRLAQKLVASFDSGQN